MKPITSSILALAVISTAPLNATAEIETQQTPVVIIQSSNPCAEALQAARTHLEEDRDLSITIDYWNVSLGYDDYPSRRPDAYPFGMIDNDTSSVMHSPQFLTSFATNIIQACTNISIVQFGAAASEWVNTFGLIENGSVELFKCQEPGTDISMTWGNIGCT